MYLCTLSKRVFRDFSNLSQSTIQGGRPGKQHCIPDKIILRIFFKYTNTVSKKFSVKVTNLNEIQDSLHYMSRTHFPERNVHKIFKFRAQ